MLFLKGRNIKIVRKIALVRDGAVIIFSTVERKVRVDLSQGMETFALDCCAQNSNTATGSGCASQQPVCATA